MFFVLMGLILVLLIVQIIYESKNNKKNKKLQKLNWTLAICAAILIPVVNFWGQKAYVEEYDIPIYNAQDFRVKLTESYATWDNGYGVTYIVPKESVEIEPFSDNDSRISKVILCYQYSYYADWACVLFDFGFFGTAENQLVSTTYKIECPKSCVVECPESYVIVTK